MLAAVRPCARFSERSVVLCSTDDGIRGKARPPKAACFTHLTWRNMAYPAGRCTYAPTLAWLAQLTRHEKQASYLQAQRTASSAGRRRRQNPHAAYQRRAGACVRRRSSPYVADRGCRRGACSAHARARPLSARPHFRHPGPCQCERPVRARRVRARPRRLRPFALRPGARAQAWRDARAISAAPRPPI